jgi:hypothetical protein
VFFKHAFGSPTDLTGKKITFTLVGAAGKPDVLVNPYIHTSGSTLKWGDGGQVAISNGVKLVSVNAKLPAWQEVGYNPATAEVIGLSLKAIDGPSEVTIISVAIEDADK